MGRYIKKYLLFIILFLIFSIDVDALSFSSTQTNIRYSQDLKTMEQSGYSTTTSYSFSSTSYLMSYFQRFNLSGKFSAGNFYAITWYVNAPNETYDFASAFLDDMSLITETCYTNSSASSSGAQSCDTCYKSNDIKITRVNDTQVKIVYKFYALIDFYWVHLQFNSEYYDQFYGPSFTKLTISNISYTVTDGTSNDNEVTNELIGETNDSLNDIEDAITDTSSPDTSGLEDAAGWLPPGPVDSLVNLPINLLQSLTNNLKSACTPIKLPIPYIDNELTLDCPETLLRRFDGFWMFWESFGLIAGVWCLYKYFINLYKWVESHLSMDEKESLGKWGGT